MSGASKKLMGTTAAGGEFLAIEDVFSTYLYTGNGSTQTITNGIDLAGEGGLVWFKRRDTTGNNRVYDTERGMTAATGGAPYLYTNDTAGNLGTGFSGSVVATSTGFDIAQGAIGDISDNGGTYASWTWRKAPRFFDCVTYTGTGSAQNIAHNLGTTVGSIFVKCTSAANAWTVYHRGVNGGSSPEGYALNLGSDSQQDAATAYWNSTAPTDTQFTVGTTARTNASGETYVAYLFAHDPLGPSEDGSDGLIACGNYTGNNTNGNTVTLGWEPQWVLVKNATTGGTEDDGWWMVDNMRGWAVNGSEKTLQANTSTDEATYSRIDPTATGFTLTSGGEFNQLGDTYIYIAIRRGPMRAPTSGTEVFAMDSLGGTSPNPPGFNSGWPVDLGFYKTRASANNWVWADRLRGDRELYSNLTNAEAQNSDLKFDYQDGWLNSTGVVSTLESWMFSRAPGFFDAVAYTGNGVAGRTVPHNLGVAPEMLIFKRRDATRNWAIVHHEAVNRTSSQPPVLTGYDVSLNFTTSGGLGGVLNGTAPTDALITLSSSADVNFSSGTYISYLFASVAGVSKCGSYTGNGSSQTINCGFTSGARFVLIKRCDDAGDWYVWDTARGIVAGNDPFLELNTTDAEVTSDDSIDPDSSGFIVNQTATTNINVNTASYIFLAIA